MIKNTGMTRKIDELGRIVIPKEIRKTLNIRTEEELQIYIEEETIVLKKYYRIQEFKEYASNLISILSKYTTGIIILTDREKVIFSSTMEYEALINKTLSSKYIDLLETRKKIFDKDLSIIKENTIELYYYFLPIISDGNLIGSIVLLNKALINKEEQIFINIIEELLKYKIDSK